MKEERERRPTGMVGSGDLARSRRLPWSEERVAAKATKTNIRLLSKGGTTERARRGADASRVRFRSLPVSSLAAAMWCETARGGS